jgi:dTDP-4-amino-4,6-dideoxygalactose transaminase
MRHCGIGLQVHYGLVHIHPYYVFEGYTDSTPIADDFSARVVSLPIFPDLTDDEQAYVVESLRKFINE